jgi:hypothetical protein
MRSATKLQISSRVQGRWLVVGKSSNQAADASIQARNGTAIATARMLLAATGRPSWCDMVRETSQDQYRGYRSEQRGI